VENLFLITLTSVSAGIALNNLSCSLWWDYSSNLGKVAGQIQEELSKPDGSPEKTAELERQLQEYQGKCKPNWDSILPNFKEAISNFECIAYID
jgi:hypothetical protein